MRASVIDFCRPMVRDDARQLEPAPDGTDVRTPTPEDVIRAFRDLKRLCRAYEMAPDGLVREARIDAFRARLALTRIADHFYDLADRRGKTARRHRRAEALRAGDSEP